MSNYSGTTGDADPSNAIITIDETDADSTTNLDIDVDFDSEDGGMQLDSPPHEQLFREILDGRQRATDTATHPMMLARGNDSDFSIHPPNPFSSIPNPHNTPMHPDMHDALDQDQLEQQSPSLPARRNRMREEEHAALTILNDWDLLVSYAINNRRTIPQTRRYFQAKLLASDNPRLEKELYAMRFTVPASEAHLVPDLMTAGPDGRAPEKATGFGNSAAYLVAKSWKEVVTHDGEGWWPPGQKRKAERSKKGNRSMSGSQGSSRVGSRSTSRG